MPARIIDGKALASSTRAQIAARVSTLKGRGKVVRLDAVLCGDTDNASRQYAVNQGKTCAEVGIEYKLHELAAGSKYDDIAGRILVLNTFDDVHAIMLHLPLPEGVDPYTIQKLIAPEKDVEGVNPANIGNIVYGRSSLAPCTALATVKMIESCLGDQSLRGKLAVCIGAGDVVGKPIAVMLMRKEATVVSCNKWTPGIVEVARQADILIAAAGVPELVRAEWIKPGAIVIDVGVNRVPGPEGKMKTVGDVAFEECSRLASWISPVPGGVGPMTVAMLLLNVVEAAERG